MPRRTAGFAGAGAGGATTGGAGGAITCGSVGGAVVMAEITGSCCVCGTGMSGGGTYGCTGAGALGGSTIFFGGGGGGGGALISSMMVAVSGFLMTSTALRARPVIKA